MAEKERKPKRTRATSTARTGSRKTSERLAPAPPAEATHETVEAQPAPAAASETAQAAERAPDPDLHGRIQERAYLIFESRGYPHGQALDHWLEAERQLIGGTETAAAAREDAASASA